MLSKIALFKFWRFLWSISKCAVSYTYKMIYLFSVCTMKLFSLSLLKGCWNGIFKTEEIRKQIVFRTQSNIYDGSFFHSIRDVLMGSDSASRKYLYFAIKYMVWCTISKYVSILIVNRVQWYYYEDIFSI